MRGPTRRGHYNGRVHPPIRAITLDLDDTVWPVAPAIVRAEAALESFFARHAPRAARQWPSAARQELRRQLDRERPHLAHDMSAQRRWMIERMLDEAGEDTTLAGAAYDAYFAARCEVEHYPDSLAALERLAARVPLAAVSNGNACLRTIGIDHLFSFQLGAGEFGAPKPEQGIFLAACERLGVPPRQVLHVGDDPACDIAGAQRAGLRTCWIHRPGAFHDRMPEGAPPPDLHLPSLSALADWLEATYDTEPSP